jgi:hypothetical protein
MATSEPPDGKPPSPSASAEALASRLLVTEAGRLVGIVGLNDLLRSLKRRLELDQARAEGAVRETAPEESEQPRVPMFR